MAARGRLMTAQLDAMCSFVDAEGERCDELSCAAPSVLSFVQPQRLCMACMRTRARGHAWAGACTRLYALKHALTQGRA